ncbi:hypothetical protein BO94DRAFT_529072 [Aspergillus sclerotioniger CBS 115572]|uniref:NadR/Ttd14 AAA domain-containing protein n=1 Tax=Aspergillus sclerotioniger CBS 115572 TaxID=1450535 RepID=A0A317UW45_9EURO|nr:hypothetical protein BO94DRAFT_529072 [Aspergillus sclerotioniger CBS 115572]PWY65676.1 hypothetical protein BO94DRAFT_529072 [Aspergillus sclerotioniger CBS 115572]
MIHPPNIYLVGAHCTGKTTLHGALKNYLSTNIASFAINTKGPKSVDEVVRHVMRTDGFSAVHVRQPNAGLELQKRTLRAQFETEMKLDESWFISDRSGIDPIVYAGFFLGQSAAEELTALEEWHILKERMKNALVIVCEPGNESWLTSDGVRMKCYDTEEWRSLGRAFRAALQKHGIKFVAIPRELENLEQRVHFVESLLRSTC